MIPNLKKKLLMMSRQKLKDIPGNKLYKYNETGHNEYNHDICRDDISKSGLDISGNNISDNRIPGYKISEGFDFADSRGLLGGTVEKSEYGSHVVIRSAVPLKGAYGKYSLERLLMLSDGLPRLWTRINKAFSSKDLIFLDTETTGLAGGTGTTAFLIGLGFLNDNELIIEQHIMRDLDEEEAMLQSVYKTLGNSRILVTFNGKSFDWPLLESRFISSRIKSIDLDDSHIDLLHISRRLWKQQFSDCSLSSLEKNVLKLYRHDDIPGHLIPSVYINYLETRDEGDMKRVIEHNKLDIISMAALLSYIEGLYSGHLLQRSEYELFGIANEYEYHKRYKDAVFYYEECISTGKDKRLINIARKRAADLLKRERNYGEALKIWNDLAETYSGHNVWSLIEIAKYFEHKARDYQTALLYTERALRYVTLHNMMSPSRVRKEIEHRKKRLMRKMERIDDL